MGRNNAKLIIAGSLALGLGLIAVRAVRLAYLPGSKGPNAVVVVPVIEPSAISGNIRAPFDPVARRAVHFLVRATPPRLCSTDDALESLHCTTLPAARASIVSLPDQVASGSLDVLAGLVADDVESAALAANGDRVWLRKATSNALDFELWRQPDGGAARREIPSLPESSVVSAPWLLAPSRDGVDARRVLPAALPLGDPVRVLDTTEPPKWLGACETDHGMIFVAREGGHSVAVFEHDGHFSHVSSEPALDARIDCERDAVSFSWVGARRLHRIRCTSDACRGWTSDTLEVPGAGAALAVIGDRLLLVSRAAGGVRLRVARPDEIARAPDRVLSSESGSVQIETRRGVALVFVSYGERHSVVFRADATGAVHVLAPAER